MFYKRKRIFKVQSGKDRKKGPKIGPLLKPLVKTKICNTLRSVLERPVVFEYPFPRDLVDLSEIITSIPKMFKVLGYFRTHCATVTQTLTQPVLLVQIMVIPHKSSSFLWCHHKRCVMAKLTQVVQIILLTLTEFLKVKVKVKLFRIQPHQTKD